MLAIFWRIVADVHISVSSTLNARAGESDRGAIGASGVATGGLRRAGEARWHE